MVIRVHFDKCLNLRRILWDLGSDLKPSGGFFLAFTRVDKIPQTAPNPF